MTRESKPKRVLALEAGGPASMAAMHQLRESGLALHIIGADMDPSYPAISAADEFHQVSPSSNPDYAKEIATFINEHRVDVVLPSFHFAMSQLSKLELPVFLNDFRAGLLCRDKWQFYKWCLERGHNVPRTSLLESGGAVEGKLYLKPRHGAGAKDNFVVQGWQLATISDFLRSRDEYLVQEYIEGEQWVVDAMRHNGQYIGDTTARVETHRWGHAISVEITKNKELSDLTQDVLGDLDYEGPANLDVIKDKNGNYQILEINPRFGGTIRFAYAAGINWPAYLLSGEDRFIREPVEGKYAIISSVLRVVEPHP